MKVTGALAEFVSGCRSEDVSERAREAATLALFDVVGMALVGSTHPAGRITAAMVRHESAAGGAAVLGQGFRAAPSMAALANGTAAHALDFDDTGLFAGHPSAAVFPGTLAVADEIDATGAQLLEAAALGLEVAGRIGRASGGSQGHTYRSGFHGTAVYGALGAAAAAGRLWNLDAHRMATALGIASSLASGVRANFGTMTKPLHAGEANRAGVVAAMLARDGFTASTSGIEARYGWGDAIGGGQCDMAAVVDGLGQGLIVEQGVDHKAYPCCGGNHSTILAITELMAHNDLQPGDVERMEVEQSGFVAREILIYDWPRTGLEGKFSLAYNVAAAWADGGVTIASFDEAHVAALAPYRSKVKVIDVEGSPPTVVVRAFTTDGRIISHEMTNDHGRRPGGHHNPYSVEQLTDRFRTHAAGAVAPDRVDDAMAALLTIGDAPRVRAVTELLL
jgi:2-methylcitrate dehydratase PrpD